MMRSVGGVSVTDRPTALDAAFLELEEGDASAHMHIGWTMVFDPLPGGGTPTVDKVRRLATSYCVTTVLDELPK